MAEIRSMVLHLAIFINIDTQGVNFGLGIINMNASGVMLYKTFYFSNEAPSLNMDVGRNLLQFFIMGEP